VVPGPYRAPPGPGGAESVPRAALLDYRKNTNLLKRVPETGLISLKEFRTMVSSFVFLS